MDDELTLDYLRRIFGHFLFSSRLLVWDSLRCHISNSTKKDLKKINLDTVIAPGGCTKFIQAPDVCWNQPFKAKIKQLYDNWMMHGDREWTSTGNPRPPGIETYLGWVVESWDSIPEEDITKSFKTCGITNDLDGNEDNEIHCFKPGGPVSRGRVLLQNARNETQMVELLEEIDLNEDEENGYLSDKSLDL